MVAPLPITLRGGDLAGGELGVIGIITTALVTVLILTVAGLVVLALAPARLRGVLVPAVPSLGAALLIVVLHFTGVLWSTQAVAPFVIGALVVSLPVSVYRLRALPGSGVRLAIVALLLGVAVGGFALYPTLRLGRQTVVEMGVGHDSAAFVGLTDWFEHHPITATPKFLVDPPAYGYTRQHQWLQARVGQDLVQGMVAAVVRLDADQTWYTVTCVWLALLPGAFTAAGLLLLRNRAAALAAGGAAAALAIVVTQVFNQNSASLLGMALAPIALSGIVSRLVPGVRRWPLWLIGFSLAALLGAYSEYLSIFAPLIAFVALARSPRRWLFCGLELASIGVATVVIGPVECIRGVRSLLHNLDGSFFPRVGTPFWGVSPGRFVDRITGATRVGDGRVLLSAVAVLITAGIGVGFAFTATKPRRRVWIGLVLACVVTIVYLVTVRHFAYGEERAIEIALPLSVLAVAAGLERIPGVLRIGVDALARVLRVSASERRRAVRGAPWLAGTVVLGLVGASVGVNVATASSVVASTPAPDRVVTPDFGLAARWLASVGGPEGRDAMVVDSDVFTETWMAYSARHLTRLAYPFMFPNVSSSPPFSLWDGSARHWALVGWDEYLGTGTVATGAVGRFRFVDLTQPDTLVGLPIAGQYFAEVDALGLFHWFGDDGQMLLIGHCASGLVVMRLQTTPALDPMPMSVDSPSMSLSAHVTSVGVNVAVPLAAKGATLVEFRNLRPAQASPPDVRLLSVRVRSLACVPVAPPSPPAPNPSTKPAGRSRGGARPVARKPS